MNSATPFVPKQVEHISKLIGRLRGSRDICVAELLPLIPFLLPAFACYVELLRLRGMLVVF